MSDNRMFDILIIGSGPAGLTAAIYAVRANKKVGLITGPLLGGQLMNTTYVENYPGFADPILGPDLMNAMIAQAKNLGVEFIYESAMKIEHHEHWSVKCEESEVLGAKLIFATGSTPKQLGIEQNFIGKGVSTCATCDGAFFKGKIVAVIGGGNTALEEAIYLSDIASQVFLVHRRDEFRADQIMLSRARQKNVQFFTPYTVARFVGENRLEAIELSKVDSSETKTLQIHGAFIAIGHIPNTQLIKDFAQLDHEGYVLSGRQSQTLFVAGDLLAGHEKQAVTSASSGCAAAMAAVKEM